MDITILTPIFSLLAPIIVTIVSWFLYQRVKVKQEAVSIEVQSARTALEGVVQANRDLRDELNRANFTIAGLGRQLDEQRQNHNSEIQRLTNLFSAKNEEALTDLKNSKSLIIILQTRIDELEVENYQLREQLREHETENKTN